MIIIKIKNAMEIAKKESVPAKIIGGFIPGIVSRKVEEGIIESIKKSFSERGIEADFEIREDKKEPDTIE